MSMNSPAKQERIERHLMRQRGAGVRTVSSNFGFCFGSSQPSSNDATPTREEPPLKRRKTVLNNVIHATDAMDAADAEVGRVSPVTKIKQAKSRRRWAPEDEGGVVSNAAVLDEADSFIVGIQRKRPGVKASKPSIVPAQTGERTDDVITEPPAKGRPRRRAAVTAAVKVAHGFADEAIPVDKKRRDSRIEAESRKTTNNLNTAPTVETTLPADTIHPEEAKGPKSNGRVKPRGKKRKAKERALEGQEEINLQQADLKDVGSASKDESVVKPAITSLPKRKRGEASIATAARSNTSLPVALDHLTDLVGHQGDVDKTATKADAPKKAGRKKRKVEIAAENASTTKTMSNPTRPPLKETDMNITIPSASPEKPCKNDEKAWVSPAKTSLKSSAISENQSPRLAKRSKVRVRQDEEAELRDEAALPSKRQAQAEKSQNASSDTEVQMLREEDVDWMFEPQQRKALPSVPKPQPAPASQMRKTRAKMPDIDLDDLLSDIASMAEKRGSAGAEIRAVGGLEKIKVSKGRRKNI